MGIPCIDMCKHLKKGSRMKFHTFHLNKYMKKRIYLNFDL